MRVHHIGCSLFIVVRYDLSHSSAAMRSDGSGLLGSVRTVCHP